jgi:hypothetical protein
MRFSALARWTLVAICLAATGAQPAAARVIGLVFDDSGSMAPRIQLPTFGVQLLASTLDVRPGKDRLLTLKLSQVSRGVVEEDINGTDALQRTVDKFRQTWAHASGGTPYAPIEMMLRAIADRLQPDENGTLFILTDGQIDNPPDVAAMRQDFQAIKQALDAKRASIDVEFILIAIGKDRDVTLDAVQRQMIRSTLLEVFNGNKQEPDGTLVGKHEVTDIRDLFDIMRKAVARISGTDVSHLGNYVKYSNNSVTVNTPLSVARMVDIATAVNADPPAVQSRSFSGGQTFSIVSRMDAADRALPGKVFRGDTEQTVFQPALDPGQYTIVYNKPVADNVFLVFETNARIELSVLDASGAELQRQSPDTYVLLKNHDYKLAEVLVDRTSQGRRVVPLSTLSGQPRFSATIDDPSGKRRTIPLTVVPAQNRAVSAFHTDQVGTLIARGQAQLDGFVSPTSDPVQIKVIEGILAVTSKILPAQPCPDCPPGTIRSMIGKERSDVPVATIEIAPQGNLTGSAQLDASGIPKGIRLVDQGGKDVADGSTINLVPNKPIQLGLVRAARPAPDLVGKPLKFVLRLRGREVMVGEHVVDGAIDITVPQARLTVVKPTGTLSRDGHLIVTGGDLTGGQSALGFKLENVIDSAVATDFRISSPSWLTSVTPTVSDNNLKVAPRTRYWCICFLWLDRGAHDVEVTFTSQDGLQTATASTQFIVSPTWREILVGCVALLLLILAIIWAIGAVINTWTAKRFPRGSFMEVDDSPHLPRHLPLRGRNWTFLRALFWPIFGRPDERHILDGLDLTAAGRLLLRVHRDSDDLNIRGEWLSERFALNEKLDRLSIYLNWQEIIQKRGPPLISIRCWKSAGDRSRES